jgi:hypothetical protein
MGNQLSQFGETKTSVYKVDGQPVRHGYYKNKKDIFYNGFSLKLLKPERSSFKKLKYSYAKTNNFVFYQGEIIPDANSKTFIVINRKNMPEEYKNLNSVIGMDFENNNKRIYQFGKLIYTIKIN